MKIDMGYDYNPDYIFFPGLKHKERFYLNNNFNKNEIFFSKKEMIFYKNTDDLSEKILKLSSDDKVRKKIAKNGKRKYFNTNKFHRLNLHPLFYGNK